jgi:hypothetical protein
VFSSSISCACGARYERAQAHLPIKDIGAFECQCCGAVLERWYGRDVPLFRLVSKPEAKTSSAA